MYLSNINTFTNSVNKLLNIVVTFSLSHRHIPEHKEILILIKSRKSKKHKSYENIKNHFSHRYFLSYDCHLYSFGIRRDQNLKEQF